MVEFRFLFLIPSFYGRTGDAVNERQLITAFSKKIGKSYLITFIGFKQLFSARRNELKDIQNLPPNLTIITLPFPQLNNLVAYSVMIVTSFMISFISSILLVFKKIDLIYIRNSFLSIGFLPFKHLSKRTIVKIPALVEDEQFSDKLTKFFNVTFAPIVDKFVLAKAGRVAVNGALLYHQLIKRRSLINSNPPLEISPGVNLELIERIKNQINHRSSNIFNIGFIGSLAWWQGVDILVEALGFVRSKYANIKLIIIGDGSQRNLIENRCKSLNITCEITGFLTHEEALKRLGRLDAFVLSSKKMSTRETIIPIKVMEAWALGIPVIVTKHQAYIEKHVKNFKEVIYCEPEPKSVSDAIFKLIADSTLAKQLANNGRVFVKQFDYDKIVDDLLRAMEKI